jgi:hypothetical protein
MYSIKNKGLLAFFKGLLFVSSLVLFGNRLTDRFHLCTGGGGLYRAMHDRHHSYPLHHDLLATDGKMLSSMDKRYQSPTWLGLVAPSFRLMPLPIFAVHACYVLPPAPVGGVYSCLFLRGPPARGLALS